MNMINVLFQSKRQMTGTNEIYQGVHQVREENHHKVEGSVTDEDVYGGDHPRIFKILPSAPQRQNKNAGVRYQREKPERGFSRQFVSFSLIELFFAYQYYSRKSALLPANIQPWLR